MGKCQSKRKTNLSESFQERYVLTENDEFALNECDDNRINFGKKTEYLENGDIRTTEISNGIIRRKTFRRKTDSEIYYEKNKKLIEEQQRIERERKEREEQERIERERIEKERKEREEQERKKREEQERIERERIERERKEREEQERKERERKEREEQERKERERKEKEKIAKIQKRIFDTKQNYYKTINKLTSSNNTTIDSTLIEDMNEMGVIMKEQIIEDQKINPNNYININKTINNKSDKNFPIALLAKNLESKGITTAIQKQSRNKDLTKTCLQLMTNGLVNKQKCEVKFDFGEKKNDEILNNEKEKEKFIKDWKDKLSKKLGISPDDIIITNLRKGSLEADILLKTNSNFKRLVSSLNEIASYQSLKIKQIKQSNILSGIVLSPDMFDPRGNQDPNNYERQGLRGGKIYKGPIGWTGHGLFVYGQYDGGDNTWLGMTGTAPGEWCVAYHGTSLKFAQSILINSFKTGERQAFADDYDLNHPGQKVGEGVYVTPEISIADSYAENINNYKCVFMCRVNPKTLRQPRGQPDYWVVGGNSNDIRPYRLLIKYVGSSF